jgi:hypothetical protein
MFWSMSTRPLLVSVKKMMRWIVQKYNREHLKVQAWVSGKVRKERVRLSQGSSMKVTASVQVHTCVLIPTQKTQVASDHVVEEEHVVENMVASNNELASQRGRLFFKCRVAGCRQRRGRGAETTMTFRRWRHPKQYASSGPCLACVTLIWSSNNS